MGKACVYLKGDNLAPLNAAKAKSLLGKKITFLRRSDIDRSGRGYFFPQSGVVSAVVGRNIAINDPNNFVCLYSEFVEVVLCGDGQ